MSSPSDAPLIATRWVETGLALFTAALGGIVMQGSLDIGIGWGDAGPEAGYFPFYIGLLICLSSTVVGYGAIKHAKSAGFAALKAMVITSIQSAAIAQPTPALAS